MHVLDENMDDAYLGALEHLGIRAQKVGKSVGRKGITDENVIPLLHRLRSVTFFTRDKDYKRSRLCHDRYCLVYLDVEKAKTIEFIHRVLRHPAFRTWAQRRGKLIWVRLTGMRVWQVNVQTPEDIPWKMSKKS